MENGFFKINFIQFPKENFWLRVNKHRLEISDEAKCFRFAGCNIRKIKEEVNKS